MWIHDDKPIENAPATEEDEDEFQSDDDFSSRLTEPDKDKLKPKEKFNE